MLIGIKDQYGMYYDVPEGTELYDLILKTETEFDGRIIRVPFEFICKHMEWGWWLVAEKIEKSRKNYDVDNLLKSPKPREHAWDIQHVELASNEQLGEMLSYFGSWLAYLNAELGSLEGEYAAVKGSGSIGIGIAVSKLEKDGTGRRPLKDSLFGVAIANNPELRATKRREVELEALIKTAEGYRDSWKILWETASRELTRRQMELEKKR